jgi:cytoskeletal protein CcmA (bactofilin family)
VTQYVALVTLETCGALVVEKRGALVLQRRCCASSLTVRGSLKGHAVVHGVAHLEAGAQMTGDLTAHGIIIDPGAALKGVLTIVKQ